MTEELRIAAADATPDELWRLLDWCIAHGADELTIEVMALVGTPAPLADAFEDALAPWELAPAIRPILESTTAPIYPGRVRLWSLGPQTVELLRRFLPGGPLTHGAHGVGEAGWLENLALYRGGELLFGAVTHEGEALLRAGPEERADLERLGLAPWRA